ncbi:hypothetical protein M404DRAFT_165310 [Pisolithus tinctorius Marx 270]|uniref:Uncharacterized protein n=1 Tax=Pisolithus tinctorius Marx 270 TaxID=870435 RepID=A0A0C3NIV4_PISTI|nr:hypothetical protein M404DRAFT_165310 [Pisolithus tinctorius Marx 270]
MAHWTLHEHYLAMYLVYMILWSLMQPDMSAEEMAQVFHLDIGIILAIHQTHYLQGQSSVPKADTLQLAWKYAQNEADHQHFINMLHIPPTVLDVLLDIIHEHPVFYNNSNNGQTPVQKQLAVTLYHMGHYGNGASLEDIAWVAGISEGSEAEKVWIDSQIGFRGTWWEGWVMYDGTVVVLYTKPGLNGDAYFTCKSNYGLNLQVCV